MILRPVTKIINHIDNSLGKTLEGSKGASKEEAYIARRMS